MPERNIEDVIKKGQGHQPCCVAFALMSMHRYRGEWGNGSIRFLHCICKMLDGGMPGTTTLTGIRAAKGWWTCDENLWPTDVDLSIREFEDCQSISPEAWEDAKQKRTRRNEALVASWPSAVLNLDGRPFRLLTNYNGHVTGGEDKQYDLTVINAEFDTVGWAQLRVYVKSKQIVLEDLFVKPEFRRAGIGSELLLRIERISCMDAGFSRVSSEIIVPIPSVDIRLPDRHEAAKIFFRKNGYVWKDSQLVKGREYSVFTAVKKLPCAEIGESPEAHAEFAFLLGNLKRYAESEEHYRRAIELKEKNGEWTDVAYLFGELGGLLEEQEELEQAETHYAKVFEISMRTGHKPLQDRASYDLARVRQNLKK